MYDTIAEKKLQALREKPCVRVLAIETSCDETAAAVMENGRKALSSCVYSQIPIHKKYGGVVPEIASRNHVLQLPQTVEEALTIAGVGMEEIDAIAVTARPGLVGALLTGVSYAKALAYAKGLPLVGVNHIRGHIAANYITHVELTPPFTCLVASGGHSHLYEVADYEDIRLLGCTRDDAAGEAFDKVARVLGLSYPGGPALELLARQGNENAYTFPGGFNAKEGLDFSFSGLKTAVINLLHKAEQKKETLVLADVAASFQKTVVDVLVQKSLLAAAQTGTKVFALAGGVAANRMLAQKLRQAARQAGLRFVLPALAYCGDNAAMIGCAGYYALMGGKRDGLALNAAARA